MMLFIRYYSVRLFKMFMLISLFGFILPFYIIECFSTSKVLDIITLWFIWKYFSAGIGVCIFVIFAIYSYRYWKENQNPNVPLGKTDFSNFSMMVNSIIFIICVHILTVLFYNFDPPNTSFSGSALGFIMTNLCMFVLTNFLLRMRFTEEDFKLEEFHQLIFNDDKGQELFDHNKHDTKIQK